jgi:hypothetical protein
MANHSRFTNHFRSEVDRLSRGAMDADMRGDKRDADRIMRELAKAETALEGARADDERRWANGGGLGRR